MRYLSAIMLALAQQTKLYHAVPRRFCDMYKQCRLPRLTSRTCGETKIWSSSCRNFFHSSFLPIVTVVFSEWPAHGGCPENLPCRQKEACLADVLCDKCPWLRRGESEGVLQCRADSPIFSESGSDTALYHTGPATQSTELWPPVTCHIRTTIWDFFRSPQNCVFFFFFNIQ